MSKLDWSLLFIAVCLISVLLGIDTNYVIGLLNGFAVGLLIYGGKK